MDFNRLNWSENGLGFDDFGLFYTLGPKIRYVV